MWLLGRPREKSTACGRVDGRTAFKYRNGSPYVAVIRLVIDVARCLLEMCGRWDDPEKSALPVNEWMD